MKRIALTLLLLTAALCTFAAGKQYVYTQIALKEGLTSTVNSICKEKDGDVWIGTPSGLYSFDGYSLKHYDGMLHNSKKVYQVEKDLQGDLWILTDKHILKWDVEDEAFIKISDSVAPFHCLACDQNGIWFGSLRDIYRYSYSDQSLKLAYTLSDDFDCQSINLLDDSHLLCCSNTGKHIIDTKTGTISESPFGEKLEVSAALIDKRGWVWIAYYNKGIDVYERNGSLIKHFSTENSSLSNNIILCLAERGNQILAGTDGGGINMIDVETGKIRVISHISGDRSSFPAHSIKSLDIDDYDNIWAGSMRAGLISVSQSEINTYKDTHTGLTNGLSNPTVLCLHQENDSDHIWIGTDGEGINRFDTKTSKFTHYSSTFKTKVVSIASYSKDELAFSTHADAIWLFNKNSGTIRPLNITEDSFKYLIRHSGRDFNLYNENDGDLLLLANSLFRYDKATGKCRKIDIEGDKASHSNVFIIGSSKEGVWMNNQNNIYLLKEDAQTLSLKGTHQNGKIQNGWLAEDGTIWLATEEGLCRFNTTDNTFSHISTNLFYNAASVICDKRSRVWIGTEKGLYAYLIESGSFALFGKSDGVEPNEFLTQPRLLARNGDIFMGGMLGLLRIGESYTIETTEIPTITTDEILIDSQEADINKNGTVKIPRGSNKIDIKISISEKDMFRNRRFRFSIDNNNYSTSTPTLSLQQIPRPGSHDITVSCTRRNGEWTKPLKVATIKVPQPWYASWWFISGCLILVILIYVLSIYAINKRKSDQLHLAMKEHEQKIYEDKVRMLINICHELRTPLTLIMAPMKRLLKDMDTSDSQAPVLGRIYRQSRRMHNILDMVLDLSKMEEEGSHMKISNVEFNSWIEDSANDIVNEEKAEGIDIAFEFDPTVRWAELDTQKCDIILMNILINAIKHSSYGDQITIATTLTEEGMVRTSVSDQGPGLGPDIDPDKMFTRFYQSKNEKYGSGIGLSYSKILVEMHGGNIGVYNNPDKGATFWWEIPVCAARNEGVENRAYLNELLGHNSEVESESAGKDVFKTSSMRLMLVDDNQDLLDFLRESLSEEFAEITTVTGGKAAMEEIVSGKLPDMIVSDVNMPEGDGFWLCSSIKSNDRYSHIPIVLLTARGEDQSQSDSYRLGADGFLAKPFEIETLMQLIRNILKRKAEIRKKYLDHEEVSGSEYGSEQEKFIIQLNKIIADNLSNSSLDQQLICRELGVSRALLYNKMKMITGAGAKDYITKIRIEKAKSLIESTSLTIAEISETAGFASQSYFSTAFKNYTGMTPSQYKQNVKAK